MRSRSAEQTESEGATSAAAIGKAADITGNEEANGPTAKRSAPATSRARASASADPATRDDRRVVRSASDAVGAEAVEAAAAAAATVAAAA